jgi:DNA-binding transcriptional MerR regulator
MFKIGEFSKLSQVPVKTLRYHDKIGLFFNKQQETSILSHPGPKDHE